VACLLPRFWLLWHRMWLEALAFLAIALLLGALGLLPGYATPASLVSIALSILVGFEAQALRVAMLCRHGWSIWGVVEGRNSAEAELRYTAEIEPDLAGRNLAAVPPAGATAHKPPAERRTVGTAFRPSRLSGTELIMRVAIIDYGSGNLRSATKAFERAARE